MKSIEFSGFTFPSSQGSGTPHPGLQCPVMVSRWRLSLVSLSHLNSGWASINHTGASGASSPEPVWEYREEQVLVPAGGEHLEPSELRVQVQRVWSYFSVLQFEGCEALLGEWPKDGMQFPR